MNLTETKIKKLPAGRHPDGRNLYLIVSETGAKKWQYVYRDPEQKKLDVKSGKMIGIIRTVGLGSYTGEGGGMAVDLEAARLKADKLRVMVAEGIDPLATKRAAKTTLTTKTFGDYVNDLMLSRGARWKDKTGKKRSTAQAWQGTFNLHCASLLALPINDVTEERVVNILKNLYHNVSVELCETVRTRIFYVMNIAIAEKFEGQPAYRGLNPARYEGHIDTLVGDRLVVKDGEEEKNRASLDYAKAPALFAELMRAESNTEKCMAWTMLTGIRTNEAIGTLWSEIDEEKAEWLIPAHRMKGKKGKTKDHLVPLSTTALALLRSMVKVDGNPWVFTGNRGGQHIGVTSMNDKLCKPVAEGGYGYRGEACMHGMRATFSTWANAQKRWSDKAIELAIAHVFGSKVKRAYDRYECIEERREMMQAWADYLRPAAELKAVA